jgi:hypothetical protein
MNIYIKFSPKIIILIIKVAILWAKTCFRVLQSLSSVHIPLIIIITMLYLRG